MKQLSIRIRITAILSALVLLMTMLAACGTQSAGNDTGYLDDQLAYATAKAEDFAHFQRRNLAKYADELFSTATVAAMLIGDDTSDEDYAVIARHLSLDIITVADDSRTVVASFPQGEEGKALKDLPDKKEFINVVKNVTVKQMTDPVKDPDTGDWFVLIGVKRADGTGAVIVGLTTDKYDELYGRTLAEKCGRNTLIIKDDAVVSSTLKGIDAGDTPEKLGVSKDDFDKESFSLTADEITYLCKSAQAGDYTVICAIPA